MKFKGREKEYRKEWWAKNQERKKLYDSRAYRSADKDRESYYKRKYGLTIVEVSELLSRGCGICQTLENLVVDHDHKDGTVRGALCQSCNKGLGNFYDNPEFLRKAIEWLERD